MNRRKVLKNIGTGIGAFTITPTIIGLFQSCQTNISHTPVFVSKENQENFPEQDRDYGGALIESETIKEFSPDLFGIQEFNDGLNSDNDLSVDESEHNRETFQ